MSKTESNTAPRIRLMATQPKFERAPVYLSPYFSLPDSAFIVGGVKYKAQLRHDPKEGPEYFSDSTTDPTTPFRITDGEQIRFEFGDTFDRSTPRGKFLIALLLDSSLVAKNRASINPDSHRYYLKDEESEAVAEISKADLLLEALILLKGKTPKELQQFCYYMGQPAGTMTQTMIDAYCKQTATTNPKLILDIFSTKGWGAKSLINQFVQHGLMSSSGRAYKLGNEVIAVDEDSAIAWVRDKKNEDQVKMMIARLKTKSGEDPVEVEEPAQA